MKKNDEKKEKSNLQKKQPKRAGRERKWKLSVRLLCCYLLGVSFLFSGITMARFSSVSAGSDTCRVAAFYLEAGGADGCLVFDTSSMKPGESRNFDFSVSNGENGNKHSEVTSMYSVYIENGGTFPLTFSLLKKVNDVYTQVELTEGCYASGIIPITYQTDFYRLTVTWDADQNGAEYANEFAYITVTVISTQVD